MLLRLLKRIWYRPYYATSAACSLLVWLAKGARPAPELGPLGRTRWRCICCVWRHRMAWGDYRIGLAPSAGQALKERMGRTMYGEARREARRENPALWFLDDHWAALTTDNAAAKPEEE